MPCMQLWYTRMCSELRKLNQWEACLRRDVSQKWLLCISGFISGHKQRALVCKLFYLKFNICWKTCRRWRAYVKRGEGPGRRGKLKTMKNPSHTRRAVCADTGKLSEHREKVLWQSKQAVTLNLAETTQTDDVWHWMRRGWCRNVAIRLAGFMHESYKQLLQRLNICEGIRRHLVTVAWLLEVTLCSTFRFVAKSGFLKAFVLRFN